jgi:vitamin B12 transporter
LTYSLDAQSLRSELSFSESHDVLESGGTTVDRFDTRRRQLTWLPSLRISPDSTLLGVLEHQQMRVAATPLGSTVRRADNSAVGISASGRVDLHRWQLDVRQDAHEVYGAQTTGKLGYAWQLAPEWLLRTSLGNAFRAPSFNELYYPDYGVESIKPERARSVELGAAWGRGASGVQATVYDNRVSDLIGYQADPTACPSGYSFGCAANVSRARLRGASLAAESAQGPWHWRVGVEFVDAKDLGTGERLTRRAARTANAALSYRARDWSLQMALNAVGQRPEGGAQLGAHEVLDLGAFWRLSGQWRVEAKLLNALDRRYEPAKDYGALGRQAWIGLRFDSLGF